MNYGIDPLSTNQLIQSNSIDDEKELFSLHL